MKIVEAEKSDLDSILRLQYLAYQSEAKLLEDWSIPPLQQTLDEMEEEYKKGIFLVAIDENGEIMGSVRAYIEGDTAFIGKLMVHPEKQGQGIGTKLLLAMEQKCSASRYELFTSDKSVKNIKLYEGLGYVKFREHQGTGDLKFIYLEKYASH